MKKGHWYTIEQSSTGHHWWIIGEYKTADERRDAFKKMLEESHYNIEPYAVRFGFK